MYVLYGKPTNRSFRVLWMLEELGVEYRIEPTELRSKEAHEVNPMGKLPAMMDEDVDGNPVIIDSMACMQYLADKHDKFTFAPGTIERAWQTSMTVFAIEDVDGILWTLAKHKFVLPEELRAGDIRPACAHDFARSMDALEKRLGDNQYVMGDQFTVPDIILGHCHGWATSVRMNWPEGRLGDYANRLRNRDAFKRADAIRKEYQ